jgi:hypothetical protein
LRIHVFKGSVLCYIKMIGKHLIFSDSKDKAIILIWQSAISSAGGKPCEPIPP